MASRWHRSMAGLACAVLLVAGCGRGRRERPVVQQRPALLRDAAALVEQALAARRERLASSPRSSSAAAEACPDNGATGRLGEVSAIAGRWSSALQDAAPQGPAVTEHQLARVDWRHARRGLRRVVTREKQVRHGRETARAYVARRPPRPGAIVMLSRQPGAEPGQED